MSLNLHLLRKRLLAERQKRWESSKKAALACGLGASTTAKIENVNTYPDYDPQIGLLSRYVEAMVNDDIAHRRVGVRLTLLSLIQEAGHAQTSDSQGHKESVSTTLKSRRTSDKTSLLTRQLGAEADAAAISYDELQQLRAEVARLRDASVRAGSILVGAGSGGSQKAPNEDHSGKTGRPGSPRPRLR